MEITPPLFNMDIPFDIADINKNLERKFGINLFGSNPKYRLVWSDSQIEFRKTEYVNGVYLPYPRVEQLPKYTYLQRQWVLERWVHHDGNGEIVTLMGGSYEPVWSFAEHLRPVWRIVEIIALAAENGVGEKLTAKDFEREDERKFQNEIAEFEEYLKENGPDYGNQTDAFVAPVYYDSTKQKMRI